MARVSRRWFPRDADRGRRLRLIPLYARPRASQIGPAVGGLESGTTCTAASCTSSRNLFEVEPFIRISTRPRELWPKMTCVMPSRWANATRPPPADRRYAHHRRAEALGERDVLRAAARDRSGLIRPGCSPAFRRRPRTSARRAVTAMRAPARITRGELALELMHTMTRSGISPGSSPSRCRYDAAFSPTSSATARSASSRSVERLPSRKKFVSACSIFSGL